MKVGKLASPKFTASFQKVMQLKRVSGKTLFKLRTIAKVISAELEKYEDAKLALIQEYADRNENGQVKTEEIHGTTIIKFLPGKMVDYNKKIAELNDVDVDVPTISIADLPESEEFLPEDVYQLDFIVEE